MMRLLSEKKHLSFSPINTLEHRHEIKSCSACQEWVNERVREWLLSIDIKTKVVQHVESDWMREWKSERVRACESESVWEWESVPGSQLLSDVQTFFHEPLVWRGCPSQDLESSLVIQVPRRTPSLDQRFRRKLHIKFWKWSFFLVHPLASCKVLRSSEGSWSMLIKTFNSSIPSCRLHSGQTNRP